MIENISEVIIKEIEKILIKKSLINKVELFSFKTFTSSEKCGDFETYCLMIFEKNHNFLNPMLDIKIHNGDQYRFKAFVTKRPTEEFDIDDCYLLYEVVFNNYTITENDCICGDLDLKEFFEEMDELIDDNVKNNIE